MSRPVESVARHVVLLLCRLSLGSFFLLVGIHKVFGLKPWPGEIYHPGAFYRSDTFQGLQPAWLPHALAVGYGYALPWVELILGALLILGLVGRVSAGVMSLVLLSIIIALISAGGGPGHTLHFDCIFFTLALLLMVVGPGIVSIDALWRKKPAARSEARG